MKSDSILAKTAKGVAAVHNARGLSARASQLLSVIDGRRDLKSLRRAQASLSAKDVDGAVDELVRGGYVQVLGAPAPLVEDASAKENPSLLLSLDFMALRTQKLRAAEASYEDVAQAVTDYGELPGDAPGEVPELTRGTHAKLETEVRETLARALRPRVEEALRVKLRPKIAEELRKAFAAALRPRLEAAVRAQLELELKPRIELELRARFARQIADMRSQLRGRESEPAAAPVFGSEAPRSSDTGAGQLFASLSDAVFAADAVGVLTQVNPAWRQLARHSESDSVGKPLSQFFVEADRRGVDGFLRRVAEGTAIRFTHDAQLERSDGDTVWVELRAAPLVLASDDAAGVCGVIRDTAEARRAAADLQDVGLQLLLLVDESEAGIVIEDAEGMIRQVNPAFCAMFGVQAAPFSFEGSATAELLHQVGAAFADVDELLSRMARIRAAAEDIDGSDVSLGRGGLARLSYRAVAEDGTPRGHLWIFRVALSPVAPNLGSLP
jgi:PAS domain S-box-containing protein